MSNEKLSAFAAREKRRIYESLQARMSPDGVSFDAELWQRAADLASPQMGSTIYRPDRILFEFLYAKPGAETVVLTVELPVAERIVFLPVPGWVIENIWQGDIDGSYHFESDASRLIEDYGAEIGPEANLRWFERQPAKRRE